VLSSSDQRSAVPAKRASRIRPATDRETSRNDENGWSIESAGQESDSDIVAGSEIGRENTLKVETRVSNPVGTDTSPAPGIRASTDTPGGASRRLLAHMAIQESASLFVPLSPPDRCATDAGPPRDTCHPGQRPTPPNSPADLRFPSWGGQDSNLRPTDYESAALTD
jgi:hypothetical protein